MIDLKELREDPERFKRGARENAEERAREILRTHAPEPLPDDVAAELRRLVTAADRELAGVTG